MDGLMHEGANEARRMGVQDTARRQESWGREILKFSARPATPRGLVPHFAHSLFPSPLEIAPIVYK